MSKARELAELGAVYDSGALSNRNLMHNPKMEVAQRGTSFSYSAGQSAALLDRWFVAIGSSYNFDTTISQSTTTPSGEGFKYSLKVEMDAAITPSGSENGGIFMKFEGQDFDQLSYGTSSAQSVTLSFWVRSNKTGTYCCQIQVNTGDSTTGNKYSHVKEYTISAANTWEKKTLTFSGLTAQAITQTTTDGFRMIWWLSVGADDKIASADTWTQTASFLSTSNQVNFADSASNEWYVTGVQLEVGDTATDFEHRTFDDEFQRCQRYFQTWGEDSGPHTLGAGLWYSGDQILGSMVYNKTMRASPTCTVNAADWGQCYRAASSITTNDTTPVDVVRIDRLRFNLQAASSGTNGQGTLIQIRSGTEKYLRLDAEL